MRRRMLIGLLMGILAILVGCQEYETPKSVTSEPNPIVISEEVKSEEDLYLKDTDTSLKPNPYELELTQEECDMLVTVILAECRGEEVMGQIAVAQCIRDMMEYSGASAVDVISKYGYATEILAPVSEETRDIAKDVITKVFVQGVRATPYRILFFYNPDVVKSEWHESQKYVMTLGRHKFFDIKE